MYEIENSDTLPLMLKIQKAYYDYERIDEKLNLTLRNIGRVGREFLINPKRLNADAIIKQEEQEEEEKGKV